MKVCFDACVIVDILGATSDVKDSFTAYDVTCLKEWEPLAPASVLSTVVYVLGARKLRDRGGARDAIGSISQLFEVIDLTAADCKAAYESPMKDYEDAQVAYSAARAGADVIVTRNKRDFACSPVSAMTPAEFVAVYKPAGYEYDLVDF